MYGIIAAASVGPIPYWYRTTDIGCKLNYQGWNSNCTPISDCLICGIWFIVYDVAVAAVTLTPQPSVSTMRL